MEFHYRYVGFGSTFVADKELRASADPAADAGRGPKTLNANEIAVDVGGTCFGYEGETAAVFDHHFQRPGGQYPSASATVLHYAQEIYNRFSNAKSLWLVAHREPDFDALCAMYLVRQIVSGIIPHDGWDKFGLHTDGWFDDRRPGEIDWYSPRIDGVPMERRWAILLAAYASRVDGSRRLNCARDRAIHAILYAAIHRGREIAASGAWDFFEEVRHAMYERKLNPLFDSLLEESHEYRPELDLLDRENLAYARDVTRARRSIIYLNENPFDQWYSEAVKKPLFQADGTVNPFHLECGRGNLRQADGIYIRDPECLLFKEWARSDIEHSFSRQGFLFTAIVYSNQRQGKINSSNYFFSLDPERAGHAHLYQLWTLLQTRECFAIRSTPNGKNGEPRAIVRERALGFEREFGDPWFDGGNYQCTIIATPNDGTLIGAPGSQGDLSDDPVALIARDALELAVFEGNAEIRDIPAGGSKDRITLRSFPAVIARSQLQPTEAANYRFVSVAAAPNVNFENLAIAEQVGQYLWQLLMSDKTLYLPTDFVQRHLVIENSSVGVWSRRGIAIAYRGQRGAAEAAEIAELLRSLVTLAANAETSLKLDTTLRLAALDENLKDAVSLKQKLALPEYRIVSRFYEASRLDEVLTASHALDVAHSDRRRSEEMEKALKEIETTQKKVEWVEVFLIAVYATELARGVTEAFESGRIITGWAILALAFLAMPAAIMALNLGKELRDSLSDSKRRKRYYGIAVWSILFLLLLLATTISRSMEKTSVKEGSPTTIPENHSP